MARKNSGRMGTAQLDRANVAAVPAPMGPMSTHDLGKMEVFEGGPGDTHNEMRGPRHPPKHMKSEGAMSRAMAGKKGKRKSDTRANVYF